MDKQERREELLKAGYGYYYVDLYTGMLGKIEEWEDLYKNVITSDLMTATEFLVREEKRTTRSPGKKKAMLDWAKKKGIVLWFTFSSYCYADYKENETPVAEVDVVRQIREGFKEVVSEMRTYSASYVDRKLFDTLWGLLDTRTKAMIGDLNEHQADLIHTQGDMKTLQAENAALKKDVERLEKKINDAPNRAAQYISIAIAAVSLVSTIVINILIHR